MAVVRGKERDRSDTKNTKSKNVSDKKNTRALICFVLEHFDVEGI